MPSSNIFVYEDASAIPVWVLDALNRHSRTANVILPLISTSMSSPHREKQLWIVYAPDRRVEYVLSVTENIIDSYPVFIFTTKPVASLSGRTFVSQMSELARTLRQHVDDRRVYSVFALQSISRAFCGAWSHLTGIRLFDGSPYYDALMSYCTPRTLKSLRNPTGHECQMRLANRGDLRMVTRLCRGFADESDPFFLDDMEAEKEARYLIENNLVWVYMIREQGMVNYDIASIAACTRNVGNIATITKVYTAERWRGKGCAAQLTRFVCKEWFDRGKEHVVLYVGIDNPARRVYDKVGFVGLGANSDPVEGVDRWVEIGFDRQRVDLGHW